MIGFNNSSKKYPSRSNYGRGSRKSYGYGSLWDWGSWGSFSKYSDDNPLYVKEPVNYATPKATTIEGKTSVYSQEHVDQIKELSRVCYFKMIGDKDYFDTQYTDPNADDEVKSKVKVKKEFYDSIFDTYIPGYTPLEQAVAIYNSLKSYKKNNNKDLKEELELDPGALDFDRRVYEDANVNDQLIMNEYSKERKMDILNLVSLVKEFGNEFKVEKEIDEKIVSNSHLTSKKMLRDYSQMPQIDLYQRLFPHFQSKLLTKNLVVNTPVDRTEHKQKIIILLDQSGSMDGTFKQDWVNAILIDRFRYVLKGEAEVFFSYFVYNTDSLHFIHIKDRQDVLNFWSEFSNEPDGGETHIGNIVNHVAEEVNSGKLHNLHIDLSEERPEILIINDGNDEVKTEKFPYKVNAICLEEYNGELKNLCVATEGKKIHVSEENKITAHSKQGKHLIV